MTDNPFEALIDTEAIDWVETPGGNALKVLWVSEETGAWSALIRASAGTVNPPHTHLGPADFYVLSGSMEYRGGVARPGAWVYEPAGAVHEATTHPEDTVYLANVRGPIAYHAPDGSVSHVSSSEGMRRILEQRRAARAAR
jgi:anti-sigma factor ChrR (cupin superfamily)